jgi:hypothetical protein
MTFARAAPERPRCGLCRHFLDDPRELERLWPGLCILGSAHGDSRGDQGLCRLFGQMATPTLGCPEFAPR